MSYSVIWNPKAKKFLHKLPKETSKRIVLKVKDVKEDPFHYLEHYEGDDFYKLRVGDYHLLIDIDFSNKQLKIRVIGDRKNIYKK